MTEFHDEGRTYRLAITVATRYLDTDSNPADERYAFSYTIHIRNECDVPARLLGRRWVITDAVGDVREVSGDGVVGQQPWLRPGEEYTYTSGAVLPTPIGTMYGSYQMLADDGTRFEAPIPPFTLCVPHSLH